MYLIALTATGDTDKKLDERVCIDNNLNLHEPYSNTLAQVPKRL